MTAKSRDLGMATDGGAAAGGGAHVPLRRCVVCRISTVKGDLLRFARLGDGAWQLDLAQRAGGRGAWLCRACAAEATAKELKRFFRGQVAAVAGQLDDVRAREPSTDDRVDGGSGRTTRGGRRGRGRANESGGMNG